MSDVAIEELKAIKDFCDKMSAMAKPESRDAFKIVSDHCRRRLEVHGIKEPS